MSQWQGPPPGPYGPGPQAPYPQGPYGPNYGPPGGFAPPPPRSSNAGVFWALGIAGLVLAVALGAGAYVIFNKGDGKKEPPVPVAASSSAPSTTDDTPGPTATSTPLSAPTDAPTAGGAVPSILTATVRTAWRDTYYRTRTRSGTCGSVSNAALRTALRAHPCTAPISSALYRTANRSVQVTITIMKFGSTTDATAMLRAAQKKAQPSLIAPPRAGVGLWYYNHVQGQYVVFSYACRTDGGTPGAKTGPVNVAAVHLGTELTNVLIWQ